MSKKPKQQSFVLKATAKLNIDQHERVHIVIFDDAVKARLWLLRLIGTLPWKRKDDTVDIDGRYKVRSDMLDAILEAQDTDWLLPSQYAQWLLKFKYGQWEETTTTTVTDTATPSPTPRAPVSKRAPTAHKPDDYVTITELAATWGIPASEARACLRASGRTKPAFGWAFSKDEVPAIKKICGVKK